MKKLYLLALAMLLVSCGEKKITGNKWLDENKVRVAIDASFENLMQGEIAAFNNKYVEAEVNVHYTSEDSVLWLLQNDSVRCAIATRMLSDEERAYLKDAHRLVARHQLIGYDAFALIVNKQNTDTIITTDEIRRIALGEITRWEQLGHGTKKGELKILFDHSGSSTVRYMRDSLCNGKELKGNVYAQGSHLAVIDMVKSNPDVIGVVSTDWLRAKGEAALSNFHGLDVNVMLVSRGKNPYEMSKICRPYQYYIANGDYPLVRNVYAITTDPRTRSKQTYFFHFLKGDGGQRIICNDSQLLPYLGVQIRDVNIR